tara:strand:- start:997 stop:1812 length:816 start_codon:yes stop_codon:yes gene_type:complete
VSKNIIDKYVKFPQDLSLSEIEIFFEDKDLDYLIKLSKSNDLSVNEMVSSEPYKPKLLDLYRIYQFVILNKRTTILEFGSGWSSLILYMSLNELKTKFSREVKKLRRNNPFELFILENEKKYLDITQQRLKEAKITKNLNISVNFCFSDVLMTTYNGKIATEYENFPLCNPDFIYLDGPDQFNAKNNINNITTIHKDLMPMTCDILKFEYFYTPGTIILADGRGANVKFLRDHLKRNWLYKNIEKYDQHIFYLNDASLGRLNQEQLKFYAS